MKYILMLFITIISFNSKAETPEEHCQKIATKQIVISGETILGCEFLNAEAGDEIGSSYVKYCKGGKFRVKKLMSTGAKNFSELLICGDIYTYP